MSAIADVARLAGVSKSTASRALSGRGYVASDTRARVESAAARIGYVVSSNASSLVTGHTRNVGVVIPFLNRWYFAAVLEGIHGALLDAGYDLTLYRLSTDEEQRRRIFDYFLVRKRVDAVIAVGIELAPKEIASLQSLHKPIVGIGGTVDGIPTLGVDDVEAARFITNHLISLGHTRIMHLGGDQIKQTDSRVHEQRRRGVQRALVAAGLPIDSCFRAVDFSMEGGFSGALAVLADPGTRPTAIVAGCDEIAFGVIVAARQLGIHVPAQLSVVGIDGHPLANMFQLTTLEQRPSDQGAAAVRILLTTLSGVSGDRTAERVIMPMALIVRASTTAPPVAPQN